MKSKYFRIKAIRRYFRKVFPTAAFRLLCGIASALIFCDPLFCKPAYNAYADEYGSYTYTIIDGQATIIGFTGEPVFLEVPESIEECPVTQIRDNAFFKCASLKQISLPQSISEIGHHTFYACSSLESVVLPTSLTKIGMGAFCGCSKLTSATIPDTLKELPDDCFHSCVSLSEIVIPSGIETVGRNCFNGCTSLSYVSVGSGVKEIGSRAFYMCSSLKNLHLPASVKLIESESAGFVQENGKSKLLGSFSITGDVSSEAEKYAFSNGIRFTSSAESDNIGNRDNIKKIPLWAIILLFCGGIGFFTLSCIIAVRQHFYEKSSEG